MNKTFRSLALMAAALAMAAITGCTQIDTGNVGVTKLGGKISPDEITAGWTFSGFSSVDEFTTKEVLFSFDNMKPKAADNLTMTDVDVDIYIKPNPMLVAETVSKYQGDVLKHGDIDKSSKSPSDLVAGPSRISREAREAIYAAIAKFPATTMHTKRTEVSNQIQQILQSELNKTDKDVWLVTGVNIRNLVTDPALETSIRKKLDTDQDIERKNKETELAKAEGVRLEAEARGQARANEIISASLTPQLIKLKELEVQKAFAGAGTHTVLMGGAATPLVNVK